MRRCRILLLIGALVLVLPSCGFPFFFPTENPVSTYKNFRSLVESGGVNEDLPAVSIVLNAAGGDAVEVYTEAAEGTRITIAEDAAEWLGVDFVIAEPDLLDDNVATAQLEQRLVKRQGDEWVMSFDTDGLLPIVHDAGYEGANLIICHPNVDARFTSSRPPDFDAADVGCFGGRGWEVLDEEPVTVSLRLLPEVNDYLIFVAAVLLGLLVLSAIAWLVGSRLREGPFRRRNAGAVALGLVVGAFVIAGVSITTGTSAADLGPSDNLAMAKDLGVGLYALSAAIPALVATIPGLLFVMLLARRRPWPDEPPRREAMPWPAPPPPPLPRGSH